MKRLKGQIVDLSAQERRTSARKQISLAVDASTDDRSTEVLICDLSSDGLLIECTIELDVDELISVKLPEAEPVDARVVWRWGMTFGCQFVRSIGSDVISAATLKGTALLRPSDAMPASIVEIPLGKNTDMATIMAWKADFERSRGPKGWQLVGFRQDDDGATVVLVTKSN